MKTWWSPSHLKFKQPPNAKTPSVLHEGALLKFEFEDQKVGYSSLFVWESLGDKSLQEHLRSLFEKSPTTHAQQAIHAARAFAENELIASSPLKNHFLVISLNITKKEIQEAVNAGFEKVKLKIGKNIEGEAAWLRNMSELFPKLRWRLDANASLNFEEFGSFWREISFLHGRIDFVEDPCPFDFEKWKSLSKQVPLA